MQVGGAKELMEQMNAEDLPPTLWLSQGDPGLESHIS